MKSILKIFIFLCLFFNFFSCTQFQFDNTNDPESNSFKPFPPVLNASVDLNSCIELEWNSQNMVEKYTIYRGETKNGNKKFIAKVAGNNNYYEDIDIKVLENGKIYYYMIKACYENGTECESNVVSGRISIGVPGSFTATNGDYTDKIRLSWENQGNDYTYTIERSDSIDGKYETLESGYNGNTYDDTPGKSGLKAGKYYYYRITAYSDKYSVYGKETKYRGYMNLQEPQNINISEGDVNKIIINFDPVNDAAGYNIYRKKNTGNEEDEFMFVSETPGTTYEDTTTDPGVEYFYYITAFSDTEGLASMEQKGYCLAWKYEEVENIDDKLSVNFEQAFIKMKNDFIVELDKIKIGMFSLKTFGIDTTEIVEMIFNDIGVNKYTTTGIAFDPDGNIYVLYSRFFLSSAADIAFVAKYEYGEEYIQYKKMFPIGIDLGNLIDELSDLLWSYVKNHKGKSIEEYLMDNFNFNQFYRFASDIIYFNDMVYITGYMQDRILEYDPGLISCKSFFLDEDILSISYLAASSGVIYCRGYDNTNRMMKLMLNNNSLSATQDVFVIDYKSGNLDIRGGIGCNKQGSRFYFADWSGNEIFMTDSRGNKSACIGNENIDSDFPGKFKCLEQVFVDCNGFVYIVDHSEYMVRIYDEDLKLCSVLTIPDENNPDKGAFDFDITVADDGTVFLSQLSSKGDIAVFKKIE